MPILDNRFVTCNRFREDFDVVSLVRRRHVLQRVSHGQPTARQDTWLGSFLRASCWSRRWTPARADINWTRPEPWVPALSSSFASTRSGLAAPGLPWCTERRPAAARPRFGEVVLSAAK